MLAARQISASLRSGWSRSTSCRAASCSCSCQAWARLTSTRERSDFFGDGNSLIEVTSVEDTARMIARVALDRRVPAGKFAFAGDRISFRQAGEIVAAQTGRALKPVSFGSESDLRAAMAAADPQKRVMLAYLLYMTNGQTALTHLQNDRYADLKLETFAQFASRTMTRKAA